MNGTGADAETLRLRAQVESLEKRIADLETQVVSNTRLRKASSAQVKTRNSKEKKERLGWNGTRHSLDKYQVERYSRQILLNSFGVEAQDKVCEASVLIVGAGGLGCPAAVYLAAAGVGRLGIVDKDDVELSNLHRQILHQEQDIGHHKAISAAESCRAINSSIEVVPHLDGFFPGNALQLVRQYDVVIDASDNVSTRYLVSDACAVTGKPLVSGAAIGSDGQLTVYCFDGGALLTFKFPTKTRVVTIITSQPKPHSLHSFQAASLEELSQKTNSCAGPCYRCLFPVPPAAENCSRCSEAGVLGPVPGFIGTLQALEAIKIITGKGSCMNQRMLVADCLSGRFSVIKLRPKKAECVSCGNSPSITADNLASFDYAQFTGQPYDDKGNLELALLPSEQRLSAEEMKDLTGRRRVLDVRPLEQFDTAHLQGSVHVPFDEHQPEKFAQILDKKLKERPELQESREPLVVVCRKGNDSQRVVEILRDSFGIGSVDLKGGLVEWSKTGDAQFPLL